MSLFGAVVVALGVGVCVALGWLWRRQERTRMARRWVERERLLDRRSEPVTRKEVLRRRRSRSRRTGRRRQRAARAWTRSE